MFPSKICCNLISLECGVFWTVHRLIGRCYLALCAALRCFKIMVLRNCLHSACGAVVNLDLGIIVHGSVLIGRVFCCFPRILLLGGLGGFIEIKTWTMPGGVPWWQRKSGSVVSTLLLIRYVLQSTQDLLSWRRCCWCAAPPLFGSGPIAVLTSFELCKFKPRQKKKSD